MLRPRRQAALFHTTRPLGIQDETVDRLEEAKERYQKYRQFIREVAMPNFRLPPKPSTDSESSQGQDGDGQSRSSKPVYVGRGGSSPLAGESGSDVGKGTSSTSPFPLNPAFRSEEVLGDAARETIWQRVAVKGDPIKVVSAELGVDVRRVAAVVRLKEIERQWTREVSFDSMLYAETLVPLRKVSRGDKQSRKRCNNIAFD